MATVSDMLSDMQKNRDDAYEAGEINPNFVANFAADALLPTDLIYTINKAGRGEAVTGEDVALSVVDAVSTALGFVSFGLGKVAGTGVKAAIKGGSTASKVAKRATGVGSIAVGAGGSIAVANAYDVGGKTDGTKDTNPSENATAGTTPQITVNITKQPQTKSSDTTDTQGMNDVLLAYVLANAMNQKSTSTGTTNKAPVTNATNGAKIIPFVIIGAIVLLFAVILIARR